MTRETLSENMERQRAERQARMSRWCDRLLYAGMFFLLLVFIFSFTGSDLGIYIAGGLGLISCVSSIGFLINSRS